MVTLIEVMNILQNVCNAKFSGFEVSPPIGLKVPVYYDSVSPNKYTFYGEFEKSLQNNPFFYYEKQIEREKMDL